MSVHFGSPYYLVLLALAEGPMHGLELQRQIVGDTVGTYIPRMTIYHSLKALEDLGMAAARSRGRMLVYEITDKGRYRLELESRTLKEVARLAQQRLGYR